MPDLATLLRNAAPPPVRPLDVDRLLAARRSSWRRRLGLGLAGIAVLGLGVPVGDALLSSGDRSPNVETVGLRRDPARPEPTRPQPPGPDVDTPKGATDVIAGTEAGAHPSTDRPNGTSAVAPSSGAADTPYPEGCGVAGNSSGNVHLENGGLGWEEYPNCSYTATRTGGYVARGDWVIEITRNGATFTADSKKNAACAALGFIQPGDQVRALLQAGANSPTDWFVRVGDTHHC
jgi:hypothetical protein